MRQIVMERLFAAGPDKLRVGRFIVLDRLGTGAMGVVYAAYDEKLDRKIALKVLRDPDEEGKDEGRIIREARAMARLSHPNVAQIHEVGSHEGQVFIAMEFVRGRTLRRWQAERSRSWREVLALYVQAGQGLAAAHDAGIVHRDFKPENALVGDDGRVRVVDFGLARAPSPTESTQTDLPIHDSSSSVRSTLTASVGGTPAYMAPEQIRGRVIDSRADQFAFCVALSEALYGVRPFAGNSVAELLAAIEQQEIATPADVVLPPWLRATVLRGLAVDPERRHASMHVLVGLLQRDPLRRRRALVLGAAALGTAAFAGWMGRPSAPDPCQDPIGHMQGVWDQSRRAQVERALLATGAVYAPATVERLTSLLDAYSSSWRAAQVAACRATRVEGVQSEQLLDARTRCLAHHRRALEALVATMEAADDVVIEHAVEAAGRLPPIDACADLEAVRRELPAPAPELVEPVERVQDALARVRARGDAGKFVEAFEQAKEIESQAETLGYEPLIIEATHLVGSLAIDLEDRETAENRLRKAYFSARRLGADKMAGKVAADLAFLHGMRVGALDAAKAWFDEAMAEAEHLDDHELLAVSLNAQGIALNMAGELSEATALLERARDLREAQLGHEHPKVATAYVNLARSLMDAGKPREALEEAREGLAIARGVLGEDHPRVGMALLTLGQLLQSAQENVEASRSFHQAIAILTRAYGHDHPSVAKARMSLARTQVDQGALEDARANLRLALMAQESAFGESDVAVAGPLLGLSDVSVRLGEWEEGLVHAQRAQAILEAGLGPDHDEVSYALVLIGRIWLSRGRCEDALPRFERALRIQESTFDLGHTTIADTLVEIADCLRAVGNVEEAEARVRRALVNYESAFGPNHVHLVDPHHVLAQILLDRGEYASALRASTRASTLCEQADLVGHLCAPTWFTSARASWALGEKDDAIALALRALAALETGDAYAEAESKAISKWLDERGAQP